MGWSGLIYAAIVAGWAAFLVPRWVRRNEETERARAADALSGIRVLQRPGRDPVPPSGRHAVHAPVPDLPPLGPAVPVPPATRVAVRRRRRALVALTCLLALAVAASAAGAPPTLVIGPALLLAGFAALARRAVRREARAALAARRAAARRARPRSTSVPSLPTPVAPGAVRAGARPATAPASPGAGVPAAPAAGHRELATGGGWQPVPVPLPTYVTAPKAPRVFRRIELGVEGAWTSGRLDPAAPARPTPPTAPVPMADGDGAEDVDEGFEHRPAVGD